MTTTTPARERVRLDVEGMSCASCAAGIEKRLNPIVAAAAMSGSSLFVVGNSLRLRRFRSRREETR